MGDGVDVCVDDKLKDAAWYYPTPKDGAKEIKDHVAFCELFPAFALGVLM